MNDLNQKTIFVLDHTQYFSISCETYINLDFIRGKTNANDSYNFTKSLWTCAVESAIEYCRIVWDVFPQGKLVRFIVSDTAAHIVNTWNQATQNMSHVLNAMALIGVPQRNVPPSSDYSVIHGLRAAIEALSEPTESQLEQLEAQEKSCGSSTSSGKASNSSVKIPNKGRIICITSASDDACMKSLEEIFHTVLLQQNTVSTSQKKVIPIEHCHLVIINVVPAKFNSLVRHRPKVDLSPTLSTEIHTTIASDVSMKLTHLIMGHYDLASTTVTGIPMKEEQNANSSANYDVEILHPRTAHSVICGNEAILPTSIKEGTEYETVTLKWCTPRGCGSSDMLPCIAQHRVTPVDVTSRPSACLINFLLNGRSVLLEMPRKSGGKITSHLLSARGGEIFIHALQTSRSTYEDPPSIIEGPGGRITDYRISEFGAFIKAHRFIPLKTKPIPDENLKSARERMYRRSRYFPLTHSSSMVYTLQRSLPWIPLFLRKVSKEDMDKADEMQCQQYIFELYSAASRGDALPLPHASGRLKGSKKIEQYRLLCAELEIIVRSYATTQYHNAILENLKNVRTACGDTIVKSEGDNSRDSTGKAIIRATTDSPLSPPHSMDSTNSSSSVLKATKRPSNTGRTLLDVYLAAENKNANKRPDFYGRTNTPAGQIAKLYPHLGAKEKDSTTATTTTTTATNTTTTSKEETLSSKMIL